MAGGKLSPIMLVPLLMAEYVTASATVGNAEMAHASGVISLWYFLGAPVGLSILAFGFARFYQTIKKITIGEAFATLFDRKTRIAASLFLLVSSALAIGTVPLSLGTLVAPWFNISYESGVWLSISILVILAATGGLRGIANMNRVHLFAIIICFVTAAVASVNAVGGIDKLVSSLPSEHLNLARPGGLTITAWIIASITVKLISTIAITAMYAAQDVKSAKIGALSAGGFLISFALLPMLIGLSAFVLMPDIPSRLAMWKMGEYLGTGISVLISIGVVAAIFSTTPGTILSMGALATRDIFVVIKPDATERAQLIFSRIAMGVLAFTATGFGLTQTSILRLLLKSMQVRSIFAVILLISVLWRRIHPTAAFWTIIVGATTGFTWLFASTPFGIETLWPGFGTGIITLIAISLKRKPSPYKGVEGLTIS
ncbi:sodium:solute symporter [Chloroflexota bacterium]